MKIKTWINGRTQWGVDRADLEILLCEKLDLSRTDLVLRENENLISEKMMRELDELAVQRSAGRPLAYIVGKREFYGRDFLVDDRVLIPRPETETMIDVVKELRETVFEKKPLKILDVGTGSGCIAVTLKLEIPEAEVSAVDISQLALQVSRKNAKRLGAKVKFWWSTILEQVNNNDYDIIVANLPYVCIDWDWLNENDLADEPDMALYAESGGLAIICELIEQVVLKMKIGTYVILECDLSQQNALAEYATNAGLRLIRRDGYISTFQYLGV